MALFRKWGTPHFWHLLIARLNCSMPPMDDHPYLFRWNVEGRKGQACQVRARSRHPVAVEWPCAGIAISTLLPEPGEERKKLRALGSRLLEFEDGFCMVAPGFAIERQRAPDPFEELV